MGNNTLHVSISAEKIFDFFGLSISNSIFTSLIVSFFLIGFAVIFKLKFKKTDKPSKFQNFVEMIVEALYNFVYSITENQKKTLLFFPLIATFFIFIIMNNYVGLIPGVGSILIKEKESKIETPVVNEQQAAASEVTEHVEEPTDHVEEPAVQESTASEVGKPEETEVSHDKFVPIFRAATADLNTTLALAIISVLLTQIFGISHLGLSYFKKFIDFSNPINFFVGILETVLEFAKIISFAFRLFGNIFAGEVLLSVMTYLIAVLVPAPFYALELFVGFIQALVFSMLSLIFFNLATKGHHEESHETAPANN